MTEQAIALTTQDQSTTSTRLCAAASKLDALRNLPARLDDETLARLRALASAPTRPLQPVGPAEFAERMALIFTLPRQRAGDGIAGELKVASYEIVLGHLPLPQIDWMVREVLRTCDWLPSPAKCLSIAERWERDDVAVEARRLAATKVKNEEFARADERDAIIKRLHDGLVTEADFANFPEWLVRALVRRGELGWCPECQQAVLPRRKPMILPQSGPLSAEQIGMNFVAGTKLEGPTNAE